MKVPEAPTMPKMPSGMFDMSRFRALDGFEAKMSRGEALKILNVPSTVSKERVREVHRQLLTRNHPDKGGSHYIATKLNEAKEKLSGAKGAS
jgi:DnaJ-domain-containing protein 1